MQDNELLRKVTEMLQQVNLSTEAKAKLRQFLFLSLPLSTVIETYLYDNEGRPQKLDKFKMMRPIYDNLPQRLLLKCSRKTLKSTLLSNLIAMNLIRYNNYRMLYVAPQETSTKGFSQEYLNARLESPPLKKIISKFEYCDVFQKKIKDTNSSVLLRYCSEDGTRMRGPATDQNIYDEVQDINLDVLPIVNETMALSDFKREMFAGTPLTTDNTINQLWLKSTQCERATKCVACNHWNTLTPDNDPFKMVLPQGLCCSKCSGTINMDDGEWVSFNPKETDLVGYHMAQPILARYNNNPKDWRKVYEKVSNTGPSKYSVAQIYNEVFGLAYDTGSKPITEEKIKSLCVLGEMKDIYNKNRHRYMTITCGVDWGVSGVTSRTSVCMGGLRDDGIYEVFFIKTYEDTDYEQHTREIAKLVNMYDAWCVCDSGPDAARGKALGDRTSWQRTQLARYDDGKLIQHYEVPPSSLSPHQNRWVLHRSDTMGFVFDQLNHNKILFPKGEDCWDSLQDLLNVFVEFRETPLKQTVVYRHKLPDDFLHALNFALCMAHLQANNIFFNSSSSSADDWSWQADNLG